MAVLISTTVFQAGSPLSPLCICLLKGKTAHFCKWQEALSYKQDFLGYKFQDAWK